MEVIRDFHLTIAISLYCRSDHSISRSLSITDPIKESIKSWSSQESLALWYFTNLPLSRYVVQQGLRKTLNPQNTLRLYVFPYRLLPDPSLHKFPILALRGSLLLAELPENIVCRETSVRSRQTCRRTETAQLPLLGCFHRLRSHRIEYDIAAYLQKMTLLLY